MKRLTLLLAILAVATLFGATAQAANNYPVVLVHGFAGYGRGEMLGYQYWGGLTDLQEYLKSQGHETHTAVVGPFSSNWDRAVELYHQIKGGCVDYGENHSTTFGHDRTVEEKCYPGLYPAWSADKPIHIISHSMGGQTARMLAQLLEEPFHGEDNTPNQSDLFAGGKAGWIKSITTIATPNNGTSLTEVVDEFIPFAQNLISTAAGLAGVVDGNLLVYDFKLEQWGLKRRDGESFCTYRDRVLDSPIWTTTRDISKWSLSPDGAAEENAWVKTRSGIYYFSFATHATWTDFWTGWEYPRVDMLSALVPLAYPHSWPFPAGMGNMLRYDPGKVVLDERWWANDGVVNTFSMKNPFGDPAADFDGVARAGKWNYMGRMDTFDHMDIVGWTLFWDSRPFYLNHVMLLKSL